MNIWDKGLTRFQRLQCKTNTVGLEIDKHSTDYRGESHYTVWLNGKLLQQLRGIKQAETYIQGYADCLRHHITVSTEDFS